MSARHLSHGVVVVGCGHMGSAIVRGVLASGLVEPTRIALCDPDPAKLGALAAEAPGMTGHVDARAALASMPGAMAIVAVKPQSLGALAAATNPSGAAGGMAGSPWSGRVVVSIMAGVSTRRLGEVLGAERVVRVMPNLPVSIFKGMSAACAGPGATAEDVASVERVFGSLGAVVRLDEALMDAFTAVAGSGPAYVFALAEGMVMGAERTGLPSSEARRIVAQTLIGAASMLARDGDAQVCNPAELRAAVTSKGGTTAAALGVLDQAGWTEAVARAIVAARDRGAELSRGT